MRCSLVSRFIVFPFDSLGGALCPAHCWLSFCDVELVECVRLDFIPIAMVLRDRNCMGGVVRLAMLYHDLLYSLAHFRLTFLKLPQIAFKFADLRGCRDQV